MLSPLAPKLSASLHAENAASRSNGGAKVAADDGSAAEPGQFDEALTSALRDISGFSTKTRSASLPGPVKQPLAVETAAEQPSGKEQKDSALAVVAVASVATTLSTSMPKLVSATLKKDASGDSRTIPVGKKPEKSGEAPKAQDVQEKEPLPSSDMTGLTLPNIGAAAEATPISLPPPVNEKSASATSRDGLTAQPISVKPQQPPVASEDVWVVLPARSEPKETEAFSLHLERKVEARNSESAAIGTSQKGSKDVSGVAGQPSKPSPLSQSNKAASSPVTSDSSAAISLTQRSGSSKFSGGNGGAESHDKDEAPSSKPILGDARESKAGFPDYSSSPVPFVKDTRTMGESHNVQPLVQPAVVENQVPATGVAKEVAIQLQNESGETINVKLVDQGGQVQVTVRSTDPSTATSLRQDLSSLTSNLEKDGWKSEISLPAGTSFEPVNQTRQADREGQDTPGQRQADWWQQETPKKRYSSTDAWDEMLTNQTV